MSEDPNSSPTWEQTKQDLLPYLRRLIVTIVVVAIALLVWELKSVLLLAFASVLVAVALLALTRLIQRFTSLGHRWALTIAGALIVAVFGLVIWLAWPSFLDQLERLVTTLTESLDQLESIFGITLPDAAQEVVTAISGAIDQIWSTVVTVAGGVVSVIAMFILVVFSGVFLAIDPGLYRKGLVLMFPIGWHQKVGHGLDETGRGLRLWLQAQLLTMVVVGLMAGVGAAIIGLPAPLALGLIAGLTEFVPIIGPFIGAFPAVLVAVGIDGQTLVWTLVLYVVIQQIEANLITPILQRRIVSIPPVLLLLSFVGLGSIFGMLGIVVAAPLTIAIFILVREFYVGDLLSEREHLNRLGGPPKDSQRRRRRRRRRRKKPQPASEASGQKE
ncbi:MAG: AI-2E family transporter [Alphaproteobacteria bacterium]